MPGGADLPYCAHLNGHGNALIREYVEAGGSYLGLCAGAYYACARVEFEVGTRLEVQGDRELCFFPGIAKGSAYKGFEYESERGAVAAPVRFRRWRTQGQGDREWHTCRDYVNGGPLFYSKSGSVVGINTRLAQGTEVLATYPEHGHAAAALAVRVGLGMVALCSSHPELAPSWLAVPSGAGRSDSSNSSKPLNGSQKHSERDSMAAQDDWGQGTGDDAAVAQLRRDLEEHEAGRQALWRTLLAAAGLGNVLIEERVAVLK